LLPDLLGLAFSGLAYRVGHVQRLLLYRSSLLISLREDPLRQPPRLPIRRPLAEKWVFGDKGLAPTAVGGPGICPRRREMCLGPGTAWCPVRCTTLGDLRPACRR
ncbi:MAG TPA: hypothetical protein VEG33_12905, partial [Streptosporangiaceae bacterium]|nr:hypothetical protein [Streptosporangiaceae bacterium]